MSLSLGQLAFKAQSADSLHYVVSADSTALPFTQWDPEIVPRCLYSVSCGELYDTVYPAGGGCLLLLQNMLTDALHLGSRKIIIIIQVSYSIF